MANSIEKMTNAKALAFVLENTDIPADVREKLENIKASIEKKNGSKSDKPTKTQVENENLKDGILTSMVVGEKYTISEMMKNFECLEGLSSQKVNALVRQLVRTEENPNGTIVRIEEKRKAYFFLA